MITHALSHAKVRFEEGWDLFKSLFRESRNIVTALARVLPQVATPLDVSKIISLACQGSRRSLLQVKAAFGAALKPLLGNYNGYYQLDLSKDLHRACLGRLFEHSAKSTSIMAQKWLDYPHLASSPLLGDTSQEPGNWTVPTSPYKLQ